MNYINRLVAITLLTVTTTSAYAVTVSPTINEGSKVVLNEVTKQSNGTLKVVQTINTASGAQQVVKFVTKTKLGRLFTSFGKRAIPAYTVLEFIQEYAENRNLSYTPDGVVDAITPVESNGQVLALSLSDGDTNRYVGGYNCNLMWAEAQRRYTDRDMNGSLIGCRKKSYGNTFEIDYHLPGEINTTTGEIRVRTVNIGLSPRDIEEITDIGTRPVSPAISPVIGEEILGRQATTTDLGEAVFTQLSEAEIAPMFRYTSEYQSPTAIEALNDVAVAPEFTDITSDGLTQDEVINVPVSTATDANTGTTTDTSTDTHTDTTNGSNTTQFALPSFCTWALPVCDLIDMFNEDVPQEVQPQDIPNGDLNFFGLNIDRFENRVTFNNQCPSSNFEFDALGRHYSKPIPYHYMCDLLRMMAPWLLAFTYIGTAFFVVQNI